MKLNSWVGEGMPNSTFARLESLHARRSQDEDGATYARVKVKVSRRSELL